MPSPYYNHKINLDGMSLELFMIDTNIEDALAQSRNGGICAQKLCGGSTVNPGQCISWFRNMWREQETWLRRVTAESDATWKVICSHHKPRHEYGIQMGRLVGDVARRHNIQLMVGSHTHEMTFFDRYNYIGGRPLLVVGAGGGAQGAPNSNENGHVKWCGSDADYGFGEVNLSPTEMVVKIHTINGRTPVTHTIPQSR